MTGSEPFLVAHASAQNWREAAGKIIHRLFERGYPFTGKGR